VLNTLPVEEFMSALRPKPFAAQGKPAAAKKAARK